MTTLEADPGKSAKHCRSPNPIFLQISRKPIEILKNLKLVPWKRGGGDLNPPENLSNPLLEIIGKCDLPISE